MSPKGFFKKSVTFAVLVSFLRIIVIAHELHMLCLRKRTEGLLSKTNGNSSDNTMNKKFPYGYDVNAYIDKAFEQMKEDFPWATRDMIAEHTNYGIEKVGDNYQFVSYYSMYDGTLKAYPWEEFLDKYLELVNPGSFYVGRVDLENAEGLKEFLGFRV